ncbi:chemotaxis protein CheW [Legionella sp. km535]|uniref:chemotaxis protein CheW n=1 Tax=Legionella sp. km535 TaxID=2498107 RepID=UPI000F8DA9C6|nr:chemotaxis protein CheW [Legionella sp. km535]RUR18853.1 chemotaxis protein CheW [Legionella sp. km535]
MSDERKLCTFYVDKYFFGIDVSRIQEVIRYQEMTIVPLADERISGLINLRGQIVTAINMRTRLEFPPLSEQVKPTNVIVRVEDGAVSFLVDDIGDVIDISLDHFEPLPENLKGEIRAVLKEVCKLDDELLLILDIDKVTSLGQVEQNVI